MYLKILNQIIFFSLITLIQIGFVGALPVWFSEFNLVLLILVFFLGFNKLKTALFWGAGMGIVYDLYSFAPSGAYTISMVITIFLAYFLMENFLTNRSLYSFLVLASFTFFCFEFFSYAIINISSLALNREFLFIFNKSFFLHKMYGLFLNLFLMSIFLYLFNFFSFRFKPVFLKKKKIIAAK
ncbi:hypothetical protein KAU09_04200 [Candidatus Parcubacteria bacterium]|nr:hypothetical protein [Candidatus Parcubacteria bacterium]